ncbi:recombinase family protein [Vibrio lentus]|uniref:recombinase family protein n=1 Tax=Vibrio lentus TaxID=136468 RepID=UPI000C859B32|nr:recombinase family protein [Vibrio lentus]MCC5488527.1 recombinase family protein [Vibrio lentus]MCC5491810.1 recombinase family protein [Vibrio lentus]
MAKLGIARVSTAKQDLDAQIDALTEFGCDKIYSAKHSGKGKDHQALIEEVLDYSREGDTVVVTKIDRLGRSLSGVLMNIENFKGKGVHVLALHQNIDTSSDDIMAKAMVSLMGLFAEMERDFIVARNAEGKAHKRARLIAEGYTTKQADDALKGGRPRTMSDESYKAIVKGLREGVPIARMARDYGVNRSSIYAIKKKL